MKMALGTASSQRIFADPADALLADVAIRVQLRRTDYNKAVSRYGTINDWIERDGSVLKDRVELFYPQGSMAIGATIASKLRSDEFEHLESVPFRASEAIRTNFWRVCGLIMVVCRVRNFPCNELTVLWNSVQPTWLAIRTAITEASTLKRRA